MLNIINEFSTNNKIDNNNKNTAQISSVNNKINLGKQLSDIFKNKLNTKIVAKDPNYIFNYEWVLFKQNVNFLKHKQKIISNSKSNINKNNSTIKRNNYMYKAIKDKNKNNKNLINKYIDLKVPNIKNNNISEKLISNKNLYKLGNILN